MDVRGMLIDIDGVLVVSWSPIPGAPEGLARLREAGIQIRLATNTTTRTRAEISASLREAGMEVDSEEIVTAPVATGAYLRRHHPGVRCLLLNEGDISQDLPGVELVTSGTADVVVIGGAGPSFTYRALNTAFRALMEGASLVVMHRNLYWLTDAGWQLDGGGFVGALEESAGVEAILVGKPAPEFFAAALDEMGLSAGEAVMVGDDVVNDVLGAQACGLTGLLVRTGKFRPEALEGIPAPPDVIVDSIADVPSWLDSLAS